MTLTDKELDRVMHKAYNKDSFEKQALADFVIMMEKNDSVD